jgi:signal transduction histidine kinase
MTSRHARDEMLHDAVISSPHSARTGLTSDPATDPTASLPTGISTALRALILDRGHGHGPGISFTVAPEPESVTDARHFTTAALEAWGMGALADDVSLVVTELITNALRHSLPPRPAEPAGPIRLRLIRQVPYVLCAIQDAAEKDLPQRREPDYIAETGRGLHIVESFSRMWGCARFTGGKVVWALFRLPTELPASRGAGHPVV